MERDEAEFVARELRRLSPAAPAPDGGSSHDGRRAFVAVADLLDSIVRVCDGRDRREEELITLLDRIDPTRTPA